MSPAYAKQRANHAKGVASLRALIAGWLGGGGIHPHSLQAHLAPMVGAWRGCPLRAVVALSARSKSAPKGAVLAKPHWRLWALRSWGGIPRQSSKRQQTRKGSHPPLHWLARTALHLGGAFTPQPAPAMSLFAWLLLAVGCCTFPHPLFRCSPSLRPLDRLARLGSPRRLSPAGFPPLPPSPPTPRGRGGVKFAPTSLSLGGRCLVVCPTQSVCSNQIVNIPPFIRHSREPKLVFLVESKRHHLLTAFPFGCKSALYTLFLFLFHSSYALKIVTRSDAAFLSI